MFVCLFVTDKRGSFTVYPCIVNSHGSALLFLLVTFVLYCSWFLLCKQWLLPHAAPLVLPITQTLDEKVECLGPVTEIDSGVIWDVHCCQLILTFSDQVESTTRFACDSWVSCFKLYIVCFLYRRKCLQENDGKGSRLLSTEQDESLPMVIDILVTSMDKHESVSPISLIHCQWQLMD